MGNRATYTAEYLDDGHLSVPDKIADMFSLKSGRKIRVIVEASRFNKAEFLDLFGVWKHKSTEEIKIFKDIIGEREYFGRSEPRL